MVADQQRRMSGCTDASLGEVIEALGEANPLELTAQATAFDADSCFDNRGSNLAFYTGLFKTAGVSANEVEFALRWGGRLALVGGALLSADTRSILPACAANRRASWTSSGSSRAAARALWWPPAWGSRDGGSGAGPRRFSPRCRIASPPPLPEPPSGPSSRFGVALTRGRSRRAPDSRLIGWGDNGARVPPLQGKCGPCFSTSTAGTGPQEISDQAVLR